MALGGSVPRPSGQTETLLQAELRWAFSELDVNGDGRLDTDELEAHGSEEWLRFDLGEPGLERPECEQALAADLAAQWAEFRWLFDVDRDGLLAGIELPPGHREALLRLDHNQDARLDEVEARGLLELTAWDEEALYDPEADGLARREWLAGLLAGAGGSLRLADLDGDDLEELRDYDFDRDGVLTEREVEDGERLLGEPVTFDVDGSVAVLRGLLTEAFPERLAALLRDHPQIRTLELAFVPGTIDEEATFAACRLVLEHGLATRLPPGAMVASGGTTLYRSGVRRERAGGVRVGVHSWSFRLAGMTLDGADLPRYAAEHAQSVAWYRELGFPEALYWFQLRAAPSGELHWMSEAELRRYGF